MLVVFYGTSAELIKMLGIVKGIPRSEQLLICNSQQHEGLQRVHKQLDIEPDIYLSTGWRGNDVANMKQMLGMMLGSHTRFAKKFRSIKKQIKAHDKANGTRSVAVIHGDTLTTVVGSYLGKFLGLPVAHVEAGLRSGHWKSPFPEEIDRRIAAKFARIHFSPNKEAEENLLREKVKGEIIDTKYNTAKDAIERADEFKSEELTKLWLPKRYCLVLLHRTELLENRKDLEAILKALHEHASLKTPVVFTEHTTTKTKIQQYGFQHYLKKEGMIILPKQPYFDFMAIVNGADYIVTDGGGLQEDAFFLGIPTMVHRQRTERSEGLGLNAGISKMDVTKVADFLENHKSKKEFSKMVDHTSPSQIVIDYFADKEFIKLG
jgi:UDP-N-acetylglucosamine 2-epimerase (non-hydrolysing)